MVYMAGLHHPCTDYLIEVRVNSIPPVFQADWAAEQAERTEEHQRVIQESSATLADVQAQQVQSGRHSR